MKLKLDKDGHVVVQDGKPVYEDSDGKEVAFDAPATKATISRLNGEAQSHRERAEKAEATVKTFEGIADPAAAIKALTMVKNLDEKKLVDAGDRDKAIAEAIKAVEDKYKPVADERDKLQTDLHNEIVGGSFARSKLISEKFMIPADMAQARFGSAFKVEGGKIVATDQSGNKIYSRSKPGEIADFEEALSTLVDQYPYKDRILKGSGASGGGTQSQGNQGAGGKTMTRAQFDALDPGAKAAAAKDSKITD